jgi:threonyl-tRNA synthetase
MSISPGSHLTCQVTIGPCIDNGFFYDFFMPSKQFTEEDLPTIKKQMEKIIKSNLPVTREEVSREEARFVISAVYKHDPNAPYTGVASR